MIRQYTSYCSKGFLTIVLSSLAAAPGIAGVRAALAREPEASPLYARSMQGAFADMAARDRSIPQERNGFSGSATGLVAVIVVDGTKWYNGSALKRTSPLGVGSQRAARPRPLGYTTDLSCQSPTVFCATCLPTSCGGITCRLTCDPGITCLYQTCNGEATCTANQPTCVAVTCTQLNPTCLPAPTCGGAATCAETCLPENCPTAISAVSLSQPGQIQLSFSSSAQLDYVLQYCTNLSASGWMQACSTNGTGGMVTLGHTNGAPVSVYRLLIQKP